MRWNGHGVNSIWRASTLVRPVAGVRVVAALDALVCHTERCCHLSYIQGNFSKNLDVTRNRSSERPTPTFPRANRHGHTSRGHSRSRVLEMATTESTPLMTTVRLDDATRERVFPSASLASSPVPSRVALGESPLRKHPPDTILPRRRSPRQNARRCSSPRTARAHPRAALFLSPSARSPRSFSCAHASASAAPRGTPETCFRPPRRWPEPPPSSLRRADRTQRRTSASPQTSRSSQTFTRLSSS